MFAGGRMLTGANSGEGDSIRIGNFSTAFLINPPYVSEVKSDFG